MNTLLLLIRGLVRAMGYLMGAFLISFGILDILGLIPYSLALAAIVVGNAVILWSMAKRPGAQAQRTAGELQT